MRTIARLLFTLLLLVGGNAMLRAQLTGQGIVNSPRTEATQKIQEADYILRFGRHQEAIFTYTNAINLDPSYAEAYMKRARAYQLIGEVQSAMKDYDKALSLNPYSEVIFDKRAALRMIAKDYKGAISDQSQALAIDPEDGEIRTNRLDAFIASGQYDLALAEVDTLIAKGFESEHEYEKQALIRLKAEDIEGAEESGLKALEVNPYSSIGNDVLGLVMMAQGRYEEAIEYFTTAVTFNSEFALAYYNRAVAYKYLGRNDLALRDLDKAISISTDIPNVYFARAMVKKSVGDLEGAIADYDSAQMGDSVYTKALYNRSYTYQLMGDQASAMADAAQIVELEEDDPSSWFLKGNVHLLFAEYKEAVDAYDEAISADPDYAQAYHNRGIAFHMSYRPLQGCEDLERAMQLGYEDSEEAFQYFCGF